MKNKEQFGNRDQRQSDEGYSTVNTGMPTDRFQGSKQILNPDQLGGDSSPVAGTAGHDQAGSSAAKHIKASIKVRPDASVETLDGKQVGGIPLESTAVTRSVAGFSGQSVADDTSKIPYQAGNYRPTTRYGKKRSEDLFELDNTISEQIVPEVDDAKDLREAPDAVMGYNGRKQFKQTRGKKNFRGAPQSLLFEASADINFHEATIATCGQVITHEITNHGNVRAVDPQADYPTVATTIVDGETITAPIETPMHKGNYLLKGMRFTIKDGKIEDMAFEEDVIPVAAPKVVRDQANLNWQIDANNVTKSMIRMQTEMGRETTEKWSPLGYVVHEPYQYNMLMHDIEATLGSMMAIAYRSSVSSLAFQRNIISKDGIGPVASAIRMFMDGSVGSLTSSQLVDNNPGIMGGVWNQGLYREGSAAALIEMFDSVNKYRTKADILGMQRSLSLHLSQADNNIDPFHLKKEFMFALDKAHTFSTIDGSYNPLLPIHATKKIDIINPMKLQYFLAGWKHPSTLTQYNGADKGLYDPATGLRNVYGYAYSDIRNTYYTPVQHPLVAGLVTWLLRHESAFCRVMGDGTFTIPATFSFTSPSLFQFMLCSASQYIALQRNIIFRDVLFAGEQSSYIWDDLTAVKEADPLHSTQLKIGAYNEDLKLGRLAPDTALRYMWNDNMSCVAKNGNGVTLTMPWYMNEQAFSAATSNFNSNEGFFCEDSVFNMSIPSIRQGVRHEYVDLIKSMPENDVRLAMDRALDIPTFIELTNDEDAPTHWYDYVDTATARAGATNIAAIRYDVNSDGRVIVNYRTDGGGLSGTSRPITGAAIYAMPKEIGYIWNRIPHPEEIVTSITFATDVVEPRHSDDYTVKFTLLDEGDALNSQVYSTVSEELRSYRVAADADTSGAISRSAALSQAFYSAFSSPLAASVNAEYTDRVGIVLNTSYQDGGYENMGGCIYIPRSRQVSNNVIITSVDSFARTMWSQLQRFFRPVNPFENCYDLPASGATPMDPLETSFYFGLCGFLASDYTQAVLERLDALDQLGLDYVEDVNIKTSPIFH